MRRLCYRTRALGRTSQNVRATCRQDSKHKRTKYIRKLLEGKNLLNTAKSQSATGSEP